MNSPVRLPGEELMISVAFATRVTSVLVIVLGRLYKEFFTDTLDPKQGVEMKWRELAGKGHSSELQQHLVEELPLLRGRIGAAGWFVGGGCGD